MIEVSESDEAIVFGVKVIPRSSKTEIIGEFNGALKVKLTAPPVDGAANSELVKLFSKFFGVPKSRIEIVGGATSKTKRIRLIGVNADVFFGLINS